MLKFRKYRSLEFKKHVPMNNYYLLYKFTNSSLFWIVKKSNTIDSIQEHIKKYFINTDVYYIVNNMDNTALSNDSLPIFSEFEHIIVKIPNKIYK